MKPQPRSWLERTRAFFDYLDKRRWRGIFIMRGQRFQILGMPGLTHLNWADRTANDNRPSA